MLLTYHTDLYDNPHLFAEEVVEEEELPPSCVDEIAHVVGEKLHRAAAPLQIDIPAADREALASMEIFKFYPQNPGLNLEAYKLPFVNRYYGNAHKVY